MKVSAVVGYDRSGSEVRIELELDLRDAIGKSIGQEVEVRPGACSNTLLSFSVSEACQLTDIFMNY